MAVLHLVRGRLSYEAAVQRAQTGDAIVILEDDPEDASIAWPVRQGVDRFLLADVREAATLDQQALSIEALVTLTECYSRVIHWRAG